ncbi:MAG: thioredoxin domain-containing protein [Cyanobacteria bacterium J06621_3]
MANRLAFAQSLYLRKHADNPVDWWTWGEEPLALARQTSRPIFLSIGYSSCHWCTVMEREAFSDNAIAHYLNTHFLPIKVDREERPDLDSLYMQALQLMIGQRGWPLNVFLSPDDLIPFYGGTYFPVEPRYGKPAFLKVLESLHNIYKNDLGQLASIKSQVLTELKPPTENNAHSEPLTAELLKRGLVESAQALIPNISGASFPMMPYGLVTLQGTRLIPKTVLDLGQICRQRALDLALGGIFDQVAGGFHRYTIDPTWTVPHFEKMLYDSGLILDFLAETLRFGKKSPAIERAIALTVEWVKREMTGTGGYFYAAQDADSLTEPDSEPEEGAFYVWSAAELLSLLQPSEREALEAFFIISTEGNFEGKTVLQRRDDSELSELAEQGLAKLFQARYGSSKVQKVQQFPVATTVKVAKTQQWPGRIPPVTDTKLIVAWNALMISGLAKAAVALEQGDYLDLAIAAAQFILQNQWHNERLYRLNYDGQAAVLAQSEDYAFFTQALLDIQQACLAVDGYSAQSAEWLQQAQRVQAEQDEWFWDETSGGYFNTAYDLRSRLLSQEKNYRDDSTPSANGIAIANLVRLSQLAEQEEYLSQAERALNSFSHVMKQAPLTCPSLFRALDWFQNITLVKSSVEQISVLCQAFLPTTVFAIQPDLPEGVVGFVCKGLACLEPAVSQESLKAQVLRNAH